MDPSKFRVIIVGGSVAGLVLAHCLHRAGIDHVVLEKGKNVAPELGASIGIMPNGARVLEQLGFQEEIERDTEPMTISQITFPDGLALESQYPQVIHERFGFPLVFLRRAKFLKIAYESYPEKTKILTNKRVTGVKRYPDRLCAVTDDGSLYEGSIIVGADGVHSRIRSEMWRTADEDTPGSIPGEEKNGMTVEYACVFGISSGLKGLEAGEQVNAFLEKAAVMLMQAEGGRVFWFMFKKLDQKYVYPAVPRFSLDDAENLCREMKDVRFYKDLHVRDLWKTREIASMTVLEEGLFKTWMHDRIVLVGDSVHKMTPNFGQGANSAIEDAAALASLLHRLLRDNHSRHPSPVQIQDTLQKYQSIRYPRVRHIYDLSWAVCRIHCGDGLLYRLLGRYYTPLNANLPANIASKAFADGETLEFLPPPVRSGPGWTGYSRKAKSGSWSYAVILVLIALMVQGIVWYSG
ncbi:hypothetical protein BDW62DRAFT_196954 [Aspergillus aurantiobrunneus]